jgi:hypothetical protein
MADKMPDIYGSDPDGAADAIPTKLDSPEPTLDEHDAEDSRAKSEGN